MQSLETILQQAEQIILNAPDLDTLEQVRIQLLGKKGSVTTLMKTLNTLPPAERPAFGQKINSLKDNIQSLIDKRLTTLKKQQIDAKLRTQTIDITLPGRRQNIGSIHPLQQTFATLTTIFNNMGFTVTDGPEIEDDYHNFTALNIPPFHPARAMQDTFYFDDNQLLRTQMSPVQIRYMKENQPPLRMIAKGKVYRRDFDLTHTPMFHQIEGLVIGEDINFAKLKGILRHFLEIFFADKLAIRFRPSYFPFTEPSAEVDISCINCSAKGCRICKNSGWLEVLGCGMVHPNVLREVTYDIDRYRGFAFGLGVDRLTMLKYGITDLRALFENDVRFLKQF